VERVRLEFVFRPMSISLSQLLEESFQIAWEYLERTGELGDAALSIVRRKAVRSIGILVSLKSSPDAIEVAK
jgi:hypothetical protein